MANCTPNFKSGSSSFLSKISLSENKLNQLVISDNSLREKIRSSLEEKQYKKPKFYRQGSYAQKTLVTPINEDYDIDDGVYLDLASYQDITTASIHDLVIEAVEIHTQTPPEDKNNCVRAIFKNGYHVDLPIYNVEKDPLDGSEIYYLASKNQGWINSDPKAANAWFRKVIADNSEQVRRFVKYLKAWADYQETNYSCSLPNGLTLTILICDEFKPDSRDDIGFNSTINSIIGRLEINRTIMKPYEPSEDMSKYLSISDFDTFIDRLHELFDSGINAINSNSLKQASLNWQEALGPRFPIIDDENSEAEAKEWKAPAIVGTTMRSG